MKQITFFLCSIFLLMFGFTACTNDLSSGSVEDDIELLPDDFPNASIAEIVIHTDDNAPIVSKEVYLNATYHFKGKDLYPDVKGTTEIRGRGNSTWRNPKKPYRLKLPKGEAASLAGLGEARNWILLANYQDPTLMMNAVAMQIAHLLEMPFTNHIIPVDVTINDEYLGNYMLTEQIEIHKNRIAIDSKQGVVLELDSYFDEDWQFRSPLFNLPVMVKDPDVTGEVHMQQIRADFEALEAMIFASDFPDNGYEELIDRQSVVNYLIVYNLTRNTEINHPKSTFIYKDQGGKYFMGPVWDFDWGFDYSESEGYFTRSDRGLFFTDQNLPGTNFFTTFLKDPEIQRMYRETWQHFQIEKMPQLLAYIDAYATHCGYSFYRNNRLWKNNSQYKQPIEDLKIWIKSRAVYMDQYVKNFQQ